MAHGHKAHFPSGRVLYTPPTFYKTQAGPHELKDGWVWARGIWRRKDPDGAVVLSVPGGAIRHDKDVGWIGGGNPKRDPYIGAGFRWVEDAYFPCPNCGFEREHAEEDRNAIDHHETDEDHTMPWKATEEDYDRAHHRANIREAEFRRDKYGATSKALRD